MCGFWSGMHSSREERGPKGAGAAAAAADLASISKPTVNWADAPGCLSALACCPRGAVSSNGSPKKAGYNVVWGVRLEVGQHAGECLQSCWAMPAGHRWHTGRPPPTGDPHPARSQGQAQSPGDGEDRPRHQHDFQSPRPPCNTFRRVRHNPVFRARFRGMRPPNWVLTVFRAPWAEPTGQGQLRKLPRRMPRCCACCRRDSYCTQCLTDSYGFSYGSCTRPPCPAFED